MFITSVANRRKISDSLVRIIRVAGRAPLLCSLLSRSLEVYASASRKRYRQAKEEQLRNRVEALDIARDKSPRRTPAAEHEKIRLGWVSSWNSRCGIAMYSRYLTENLDKKYFNLKIFASTLDDKFKVVEPNVIRCWGSATSDEVGALVIRVLEEDIAALVVQFNSLDSRCLYG